MTEKQIKEVLHNVTLPPTIFFHDHKKLLLLFKCSLTGVIYK